MKESSKKSQKKISETKKMVDGTNDTNLHLTCVALNEISEFAFVHWNWKYKIHIVKLKICPRELDKLDWKILFYSF